MTQEKKMGRPPVEKPLKDRIFVLVNDETKEKLITCTKELKITRSDVVRKGIDMVYDSLKKE